MLVYVVNVWVKEGYEADFSKACAENHLGTREEPGNLRFDVLQSRDTPGEFTLYEVYRDEAAVKAHKETQHYLRWRETVEPWMAEKRQGRQFSVICPHEEKAW